jgi:hypothetical protein
MYSQGKNAHLFADSALANAKQANRSTSSKARPVILDIGFVVVAMFQTFDRLYYRPSKDETSKFFITDFECWTPEGKKWLIQSLGDDKAAHLGAAIK